ncbi:MAG: hypothetical protein WC563_15245 [Brevundimonas sp.]
MVEQIRFGYSCCMVGPTEFFVESNCPRGGDSGWGGKTTIRIKDQMGWNASIQLPTGEMIPVDEIVMIFGGDAEACNLAAGLEAVGKRLRLELSKRGGYPVPEAEEVILPDPPMPPRACGTNQQVCRSGR